MELNKVPFIYVDAIGGEQREIGHSCQYAQDRKLIEEHLEHHGRREIRHSGWGDSVLAGT